MGVLKSPVKLSNKIFRYSKMSDIQSIVSGEKAYPLKSKQVQSFSCQENNSFWGRSASDVGVKKQNVDDNGKRSYHGHD